MNYNRERSVSHYRVCPIVMKVGEEQTITITPIGSEKRFHDDTNYIIKIVPNDNFNVSRDYIKSYSWGSIFVRAENGAITFTHIFPSEQKWTIALWSEEQFQQKAHPMEFYVYALESDLYERNPYMGDLHVHSCGSDGKEAPAIVAANYRKEGFDFMALTDHHRWEPSDEMIDAYSNVRLGIKLFHGEEVHDPMSWLHIVNFGGRRSVNAIIKKDPDAINEKVQAMAKELQVPESVGAFDYAYRVLVTEEIHRAGGLAILAHPCWRTPRSLLNNMSCTMYDYDIETKLCDAVELIGGLTPHENNLQIALYCDQLAKGRKIAIVGTSDSHGTDPADLFGVGRTIVFAKDNEFASLCDAIKSFYSVAIEAQPNEEPRVYGSYRLVNYARFLLNHFFPLHNELCVEEGVLMREYVLGDERAGKRLSEIADRVGVFTEKILRNRD